MSVNTMPIANTREINLATFRGSKHLLAGHISGYPLHLGNKLSEAEQKSGIPRGGMAWHIELHVHSHTTLSAVFNYLCWQSHSRFRATMLFLILIPHLLNVAYRISLLAWVRTFAAFKMKLLSLICVLYLHYDYLWLLLLLLLLLLYYYYCSYY